MFADARERVGSDFIEIEVDLPLSVLQFKEQLAVQFESLRSLVEFGRIAIGNEFVSDSTIIDLTHCHSVIALIPPVSGG
jgi:molybdopterin converting factor small subunit